MTKLTLTLLLALGISASPLFAGDNILENANTYYQLGGGSDYSMPPVTSNEQIHSDGVNIDTGFTSDAFTPAFSMDSALAEMEASLQGDTQLDAMGFYRLYPLAAMQTLLPITTDIEG